MASLSPQFTEQPPQLPRGVEAGAVQELTCPLRSELGGPGEAELGGPLSLEGEAAEPLEFDTQAASDRAMSTKAASDAPDRMRRGSILIYRY
jgi:hypothetical protein